MSVTVPFLTKLPSESETDTTALTTADLSLFLKLDSDWSILALATFWDVERVMLRESWLLPRFRDRFGASMSMSLVPDGALTWSTCFPKTVPSFLLKEELVEILDDGFDA